MKSKFRGFTSCLLGFVLAWGLVGQAWADSQQGGFPVLRGEVEILEGRVESLEAGPDAPCYDNQNRYVDCGNGTVTDTVTALVWTKDAGCITLQTYRSANNAAAALGDGSCGLTDNSRPGDWRLPTQAEWAATIAEAVNLGCTGLSGPSLTDSTGTVCFNVGLQPFDNVDAANKALYWSSTTVSGSPLNAYEWNTNGNTTHTTAKVNFVQGWAIRGGH